MKVLHVIPSLSVRTGGPPVAVVESALALRDCGVEMSIFATDMAAPASSGSAGRVAHRALPEGARDLDVRLFPAMPPRRLAFSPALGRALADHARDYDVIHVHSLYLHPQFAASRAARRAVVPYVVSPRGALDPYLRRRTALVKTVSDAAWGSGMLRHAAALHLTSDEEKRQVDGIAPSVARAVIANGVRWRDYAVLPGGEAFRRVHLHGSDAPLVLFLGRISHKKGLDVLVRALAIVRREIPGTMLAIAGPDDERRAPPLLALASSLGISGAVIFPGMLLGDEKRQALAAADIWALPSHGENFGNAVVEAMAASRAVVISPEVNIARDIGAAAAGVVATRTPESFAASVISLLRDPDGRRATGDRARVFAERYDWSRIAPQMADMYERVAQAA